MFQLIISPLEEHSKKPAEARKRIVELLGDLPRIELFARQRSPGWDAWGNEVDSSLDMDYRREQDERIAGIFEKQAQCGRLFHRGRNTE